VTTPREYGWKVANKYRRFLPASNDLANDVACVVKAAVLAERNRIAALCQETQARLVSPGSGDVSWEESLFAELQKNILGGS
jgi:hypothetical protein